MVSSASVAQFRSLGARLWLGARPGAATGTLKPVPPAAALAAAVIPEPREWLLPGVDEVFRGIYTRAAAGTSDVLAVCSAIGGEGKTTVSLGLGATIAQDFPDRQVLIVETDFQRPVLAKDLGLDPNPGLVECLLQGLPLSLALRDTLLDNLHVIPAGGPPPSTGRLLRSRQMEAVLDAMRQSHDTVIVDVPAMLTNSDALGLTDLADGVIFVIRAGVTPLPLAQQALAEIDEGKLRGTVLNGGKEATPSWVRRLLGW